MGTISAKVRCVLVLYQRHFVLLLHLLSTSKTLIRLMIRLDDYVVKGELTDLKRFRVHFLSFPSSSFYELSLISINIQHLAIHAEEIVRCSIL